MFVKLIKQEETKKKKKEFPVIQFERASYYLTIQCPREGPCSSAWSLNLY